MSEPVLRWLVESSWQVMVLVLLILVVQRAFRHWLPPRWSYALWLLVALRLAVPVQLSVPAGVWSDDLRPTPWAARPRQPAAPEVTPEGAAEREPQAAAALAARPARLPARTSSLLSAVRPTPADPVDPVDQGTSSFPIARTAFLLYLGGALVALLRALGSELWFRRRLRRARSVSSGLLRDLVDEGRTALGLSRGVEVLETDAVTSPAVLGLRRPRLLLPPGIDGALDRDELRLVILHELAHVRRGDVALNVLLALLRCAYWFHPFVHLALARLQAAQESVRDWEALAARGAASPRSYANTLIKLLERASASAPMAPVPPGAVGFFSGHRPLKQMKRRILMITRFDSTPRGRLLGSALFVGLGWVAFTSAAPLLPAALEDPQGERPVLHVERQPTAAWKVELEKQLATVVNAETADASLGQVIELMRQASGVNFVVQPGLLEEYAGHGFALQVEEKPLSQVLSLLCRMADDELDFGLVDGAVYVGQRGSIPQSFEQRFYDVGPLLGSLDDDDRDEATDQLVDLLREFTGPPDSWDEFQEASILQWQGLLIVSQTRRGHASIEAFLTRLLARGVAAPESEAWRPAIEEALAQEVDVKFDATPLSKVVAYLSQLVPAPVLAQQDRLDETISLEFSGVRLAQVFEWIARLTDLEVRLSDGAILLDEEPEFTLEMYPVGDLLDGDDERRGELEDLLRESVDRESWDNWDQPRVAYWGDLLIVTQMPAVQAGIESFLGALRRASR